MEIKTTEDIMYKYVYEEDHCLRLYDINPNVQWVRVDDLIKELDKTWNLINKYKMDRHPNYISKTQVASFLSEIKDALTSNSEPKGSKTNKDLEVSAGGNKKC